MTFTLFFWQCRKGGGGGGGGVRTAKSASGLVYVQLHMLTLLSAWTTKDCLVTRIIPSHNFFIEVVQKVNEIYCSSILPELLGKWWSKQNITVEDIPTCSSQLETQDPSFWCYCGLDDEEVDSDLIGCDNQQRPVKWFHTACLLLDIIPRGKWYCPDCKPV